MRKFHCCCKAENSGDISYTDLFDAASRGNNDVIVLPAIRRVSGNDFVPAEQCTGTPRHSRATVELLHQEMPNFLAVEFYLYPTVSTALIHLVKPGLTR